MANEHHIKRVREALFSGNAACMVGAGFSKNADEVNGGRNSFPTWKALVSEIASHLYDQDSDDFVEAVNRAGTTSGALRLAQEFLAAFNRSDLNRLIERFTPDGQHVPGSAHKELLELPWVDVFTTNYDTLLERAAKPIFHKQYSVVSKIEDLPASRQPRIVKLHGSIPDERPYILTEEDFRTYPINYAPFVNEVRVSLMENVFCLFGFSGDDPNFLAWTGWVRDQLGEHVPPIYWFDFGGHTKSFQRRLLEGRGIVPISLVELLPNCTSANLFGRLFELFRDRFPCGQPTWNMHPAAPTAPHWFGAESNERSNDEQIGGSPDLMEQVEVWKANREGYLGWYVLTVPRVAALWENTRYWERVIKRQWGSLDVDARILVASELCWRLERAIMPIFDDLADNCLAPLFDEYGLEMSRCDYLTIGLNLLRHYREISDWNRHESILRRLDGAFKEEKVQIDRDFVDFFHHEQVLAKLTFGQFRSAIEVLTKWDTTASASHWLLRKAALAFEMAQDSVGLEMTREVLQRVNENRSDDEFYLRSVEGGALFLIRKYESHSQEAYRSGQKQQQLSKYNSRLYDLMKLEASPEPIIQDFSSLARFEGASIASELSKFQPSVSPSIYLGHEIYQPAALRGSAADHETKNSLRFARILDQAGVPIVINSMGMATLALESTTTALLAHSTQDAWTPLMRLADRKFLLKSVTRYHLDKTRQKSLKTIFKRTVTGIYELLGAEQLVAVKYRRVQIQFRVEFLCVVADRLRKKRIANAMIDVCARLASYEGDVDVVAEAKTVWKYIGRHGTDAEKSRLFMEIVGATTDRLLDINRSEEIVSATSPREPHTLLLDEPDRKNLAEIGRRYASALESDGYSRGKRHEIIYRLEALRRAGILDQSVSKQFVQRHLMLLNQPNGTPYFAAHVRQVASQLNLQLEPTNLDENSLLELTEDAAHTINSKSELSNSQTKAVLQSAIQVVKTFNPNAMSNPLIAEQYGKLTRHMNLVKDKVLLQQEIEKSLVDEVDVLFDVGLEKNLPILKYRVPYLKHKPNKGGCLADCIMSNLSSPEFENRKDAYTAIHWWYEIQKTHQLPAPDERLPTVLFAHARVGTIEHMLESCRTIRQIWAYLNDNDRAQWRCCIVSLISQIEAEVGSPESMRRFGNNWIPSIGQCLQELRATCGLHRKPV